MQRIVNSDFEKYHRIIENLDLGILEVNNDEIIVKAHQRFCEMTGYTPEELIGKKASEILIPADYQKIIKKQTSKRKKGQASSYEAPLLKKDGSLLWVVISGAPIINEKGLVEGSVGIHYDISQRKQLEEDLLKAKQIAELAQKAEKQFLTNVSHEIRTPLNAIIGMSNMLHDTQLSDEQKEYLSIIKTSSGFLHSLVNNLLDMAKIEAGKIEIHQKPFQIRTTFTNLYAIFHEKLIGKPVAFKLKIDETIPEMVIGDELILQQILYKLLDNAQKFTREGHIALSITKKEDLETQSLLLEFSVSDTGKGIPAHNIDLIFNKFKQFADPSETGISTGTGLGLTIVKELISLQKGSITVMSEPGRGSTFSFVLPLGYTEIAPPETTNIQTPYSGAPLSEKKILVVEDNPMNQKYITFLFKKWGVSLNLAIDGVEAIEKIKQEAFDLILMDIQMPNLNGYQTASIIRNTKNRNQNIPIVALTASAFLDQKSKALEAGMDDFLPKPFSPLQLEEKLKEHLYGSSIKPRS